jgi:hypothetical protein
LKQPYTDIVSDITDLRNSLQEALERLRETIAHTELLAIDALALDVEVRERQDPVERAAITVM